MNKNEIVKKVIVSWKESWQLSENNNLTLEYLNDNLGLLQIMLLELLRETIEESE